MTELFKAIHIHGRVLLGHRISVSSSSIIPANQLSEQSYGNRTDSISPN